MKSHQCNTDPVTAADVVIVLWRQHIFFIDNKFHQCLSHLLVTAAT